MAIDLPAELKSYKSENRERARRAIASIVEDVVRKAGTEFISVEKVMRAGAKDRNGTTACLRAWRSGEVSVAETWADPPAGGHPRDSEDVAPPAEARSLLARRIREAKTDGDREGVMHELAALVADGIYEPDEAREIRGPLQEARQAAEAKRGNEPPPEDPTKLLLASPEAMMAARALDKLVSDERFDRLLAMIAAELDADVIEHPTEEA